MSHEILYTHAARGLKPGSHGFCTVEATSATSMSLTELLESLSGYRHAFAAEGTEASQNPISFAHAIVRVDREEFQVLSRVANAGTDAEGHPNRIAHHVALERNELTPSGPAAALASPGFCEMSWHGESRLLPQGRLPAKDDLPPHFCHEWEKLAGDAGWAGVLAESALNQRIEPVCLIFEPGMKMLPLFVEAISLLPSNRRWQVTFSTYVANLRAEVDYDWKCYLSGTPEAAQARANPRVRVIDLSQNLGQAEGGELVELARNAAVLSRSAKSKFSSTKNNPSTAETSVTSDSPKPKKPSVPLPPMDEPVELTDIQPVELEEAKAEAAPKPKPRAIPSPKTRAVPVPQAVSKRASAKTKSNRSLYYVAGGLLTCLVVAGILFGSGMFSKEVSDSDGNDESIAQLDSPETDDSTNRIETSSAASNTNQSNGADTVNMTRSSNASENGSTQSSGEVGSKNGGQVGTSDSKRMTPVSNKDKADTKAKSSTEVAKVDSKKVDEKSDTPANKSDEKKTTSAEAGTTPENNPPNPGTIAKRPKRVWHLAGQPAALRFFDSGEDAAPKMQPKSDDRLLTLPEYYVDVALSPSLTMRVLEESLVELMVPWDAETSSVPVVRVLYGRLLLSGAGSQPVELHLRAGKAGSDNGTLTMTPPESGGDGSRPYVAVDVARNRSKPDEVNLAIHAAEPSAIQWDGKSPVQAEPPGEWASTDAIELSDPAIKLLETQQKSTLIKKSPPYSDEYRVALVELLNEEVESPGIEDQAIAARCLASMGEFENLGRLIATLDKTSGRKLQNDWQLIVGTMQSSAEQSPNTAAKVFDALKTRHVYSPTRNELAMLRDLIGGISPEQLEITIAAQMDAPEKQLAKGMYYCLQSKKVVLRTFAAWNLRHLSGDFLGYNPCQEPDSRTNERALPRWSKTLGLSN